MLKKFLAFITPNVPLGSLKKCRHLFSLNHLITLLKKLNMFKFVFQIIFGFHFINFNFSLCDRYKVWGQYSDMIIFKRGGGDLLKLLK